MLADVANILTTAISDLGGVAYVMPASAAPDSLGENAGIQHPLLSFRFREQLQAAGKWNGPGFCCIITDNAPALEIATHEAAHYLLDPPMVADVEARFIAAPESIRTFASVRLWESVSSIPSPAPRPWLRGGDHGLPFLRALCHIVFRVELSARTVSLLDVLPPHRYQLSPMADYWRSLLPECRERASEPIRTILSTPAPTAAAELWAADVAGWELQNTLAPVGRGDFLHSSPDPAGF